MYKNLFILMYKFFSVLFLVSWVAAAPSYPLGGYGIPSATSYSSRIDYHSPIVAKAVVAGPGLGYGRHYGNLNYPFGGGLYYGNNLRYGHGLDHGNWYGSFY